MWLLYIESYFFTSSKPSTDPTSRTCSVRDIFPLPAMN
jgi:hypothetical protein